MKALEVRLRMKVSLRMSLRVSPKQIKKIVVKLQHLHFLIANSPNVMPIRGMSHTELLSAGVQFPERRCVMFLPAGHIGSSGPVEVTFTGEFTGIVNPSISPSSK